MSDRTADERLRELDDTAKRVGTTITAETRAQIEQKLRDEDERKARYQAERAAEQARLAEQKLAGTQQSTDSTVTRPDTSQPHRPHAWTESAQARWAETGPETGKDREVYTAERRLRNL